MPYKMWIGKKPNLNNFQPWGSAIYIHDPSHKYRKLGPRDKSVFL